MSVTPAREEEEKEKEVGDDKPACDGCGTADDLQAEKVPILYHIKSEKSKV
jgi:hypothetical protein